MGPLASLLQQKYGPDILHGFLHIRVIERAKLFPISVEFRGSGDLVLRLSVVFVHNLETNESFSFLLSFVDPEKLLFIVETICE